MHAILERSLAVAGSSTVDKSGIRGPGIRDSGKFGATCRVGWVRMDREKLREDCGTARSDCEGPQPPRTRSGEERERRFLQGGRESSITLTASSSRRMAKVRRQAAQGVARD